MQPKSQTLIAGFSLTIFAAIGLLSSGTPTLYCPFPTLTVIPAFVLVPERFHALALLIPTLLFFVWNPGLLSGQSELPKRTIVLLALLSALSLLDFVLGWSSGVKYQGSHHTFAMLGINLAWLTALWVSTFSAIQRKTFLQNLLCHWLVFVWLSWYAFPYLGELP